jgi:hypothetical protein
MRVEVKHWAYHLRFNRTDHFDLRTKSFDLDQEQLYVVPRAQWRIREAVAARNAPKGDARRFRLHRPASRQSDGSVSGTE